MSQFNLGSYPFWARVCSVLDPQGAINELLNCVLRVVGNENGGPMWTAALEQCGISLPVQSGFMSKSRGEPSDYSRLGVYVQRWVRWAGTVVREDRRI